MRPSRIFIELFIIFVRQVIKPKRCARLFGKQLYCDTDKDEQLSRQEWTNCFNNEKLNRKCTPKLPDQRILHFKFEISFHHKAELFSQGAGFMGNHFEDEYEDSVDEYEDEDDNNGSNSDTTNRRIDFGRRQKPFLTPVTPYPPVYCKLLPYHFNCDRILMETKLFGQCCDRRRLQIAMQFYVKQNRNPIAYRIELLHWMNRR